MNITAKDIETLATEARHAGDIEMNAICLVALGEADGEHARLAGYPDQDDAWNDCVHVIEEARAACAIN